MQSRSRQIVTDNFPHSFFYLYINQVRNNLLSKAKIQNKYETNNKQTRKVVATKQLLALPCKDKKKLLQRSRASSAEKSGNYTCEVCQVDCRAWNGTLFDAIKITLALCFLNRTPKVRHKTFGVFYV